MMCNRFTRVFSINVFIFIKCFEAFVISLIAHDWLPKRGLGWGGIHDCIYVPIECIIEENGLNELMLYPLILSVFQDELINTC